jgi:hypothetical protein
MTELVDHMPWLAVAGGSRCSGVVWCGGVPVTRSLLRA